MSELLYPPYLQWEVASECNHKCIHCYNYWRANNSQVENCVELEAITEKIIERKPLYVALTGGEPLLVFHKLKSCIDKMIESGIKVSISTNGTLITEEMALFFCTRKIDLVISLPSIEENVCDSICNAKGVVKRFKRSVELLKRYNISTTINIVLTKLNIGTLQETLKAVNEWGFSARVGVAQRPINASSEYLKYEIDRADLRFIVKCCVRARKDWGLEVDLSVCLPDCAFENEEDYANLEKGSCFAGTIAYAITTTGDVKACQCDTRVYGNILYDSFSSIYSRMSEWRNGKLIPDECKDCLLVHTCRGGCRVESYASHGNYKALPTFAIPGKMVPPKKNVKTNVYTEGTIFSISPQAVFLKDKECYRVSNGIAAVYLTNPFAEWLINRNEFSFQELLQASQYKEESLTLILNMLQINGILEVL